MSDPVPISPQEIQALADSVNSLKTGGMIFIVVMTVIILAYMMISKYFAWKKEKLISDQKSMRVEAQIKALTSINESLGLVKTELTTLGQDNKRHNEALLLAHNHVNSQLDQMGKKIRGIIPDVDASKIIKVYFNSIIRKEVSFLVEAQIIENGFAESKDFIRRRMKSNIKEILDRCQDELKGLKLPISVRSIFLTYEDKDGDRYQVCDLIWDAMEPILARGGDKKKNIEEAKLIILNVLNDYINPVIKELTETATDKYEAALEKKPPSGTIPLFKPIRTPLPG
jgi:hypothetical protein